MTQAHENTKPTVLIIDDSKLVRVSLNRALRNEFEIIEAVDGEEGWELLNANDSIQVVITDAGMPRLDGYELIQRIRSQEQDRIRDIPVLMITGAEKAETGVREKALSLGASDFITKPFDNVQLVARTRSYIKLETHTRSSRDLEAHTTLDPLTKTGNTKYLLEQVSRGMAFATRHAQPLSLLVIGIDKWEQLLSEHGETKVDKIQIAVAEAIKPMLRQEDAIARIETGTFAILTPSLGVNAVGKLAGRIQHMLQSQNFLNSNNHISITVSVGAAGMEEQHPQNAEAFLSTARQRLKTAQSAGGNRIIGSGDDAGPATASVQTIRVSIDSALKLLAEGNTKALANHLPAIANRIVPLVELCNRELGWQLDAEMEQIKHKLK